MKLLLVDDNPSNLFMLGKLAQSSGIADVQSFRDPLQALDEARRTRFDLMIVDYMMPGIDGLALIAEIRRLPDYADVPIVMVTTVDQREICYAALEAGATDFLTKPVDMAEAKARLRNLAMLREMQNKLRDRADWLQTEVRKATQERAGLEEEIILRLARAVERRDPAIGSHLMRVARTARELAEELGQSEQYCQDLYVAALMHDIGKIGLSDDLLDKSGAYTDDERRRMQAHTLIGGEILDGSRSRVIRLAAEIAETHHEAWDGTGYPRGLKEAAIPLSGRIVAVADVFDALTSERPYKAAWTAEDAGRYIADNAGRQFDPDVAKAFSLRYFRILRIGEAGAPFGTAA
jgi:putative two-component system response regulator/two-component system response regulator RpfG